ncbi:MAG: hypothetical protein WC554_15460 [Clostridia bacterium]
MTQITKNLGLVRAIHVGINPPINTQMIWYNTNPGENRHYYYDLVDLAWKQLYGGGISYTFNDSATINFTVVGTAVTANVITSIEFPLSFNKDKLEGPNFTLTVPHMLNAELVSFEIWNNNKSPIGSQYIPVWVDENTHTIDFGEEIEGDWYLIAKKRKDYDDESISN